MPCEITGSSLSSEKFADICVRKGNLAHSELESAIVHALWNLHGENHTWRRGRVGTYEEFLAAKHTAQEIRDLDWALSQCGCCMRHSHNVHCWFDWDQDAGPLPTNGHFHRECMCACRHHRRALKKSTTSEQ
jgi:hypothetical protein